MATPRPLDDILKHPAVWRYGEAPTLPKEATNFGFDPLDQVLPAGGWEEGGLTEILANEQGIGELSLLLPAASRVSKAGRGIVLVAPPFVPFPHAWEAKEVVLKQVVIIRAQGKEALWAMEQAARSGACGMVIGWTASCAKDTNYQALRRLQMAADTGKTLLALYRPQTVAGDASAAPTRLRVWAAAGDLQIHAFKRRAAMPAPPIRVSVYPKHWTRPRRSRGGQVARPVLVDAAIPLTPPSQQLNASR
ncbi:MAG: translesion DNA synthesis-associated protein ImuA [Betaproteobacteria bacterium]|nr:translesion DNA synthesis-associated protein ImuA [Betaproteobacteria bacterium]